MNKTQLCIILIGVLIFSGCTVHRLQQSEKLGGYVVARYAFVIPEYTIDLDKKAPKDLKLAKKRYLRRKNTVESYYIKMSRIDSNPERYFGQYTKLLWSGFANTLKMPFHMFSEYKYEHSEEYSDKLDERDTRKIDKEREQISKLMLGLYEFLKQDMEKENAAPAKQIQKNDPALQPD